MTRDRHPRPRGQRWIMLGFLALFSVMTTPWALGRQGNLFSFELIANAVAMIVALLLELFVMPRVRLMGSVLCPSCRRDNSHNSTKCVYCAQTWQSKDAPVYLPDLKFISASRRAHWTGIAVMAVGALVLIVIPLIVTRNNFAMGPYFVAFYYFYELTTGILLLRLKKSLIEHRGSLCLNCAYPLDPSMTQCPECGKPGERGESRQAWASSGIWQPDEATAAEMIGGRD